MTTPAAARRVLLALTWTRWFPVGFLIPATTLFPLERGLSVADTLTAMAFTGLVSMLLELPTSGFADATGRRRVYVTAAAVNVVAGLTFAMSSTFWMFALAAVLSGVFRALDSGPLEAWFVDTVHATDPDAEVDGALSAGGTLLGTAIALGALGGAGLIWWHPVGGSALLLPVLTGAGLNVVHLIATALLIREPTGGPAPSSESGERPAARAVAAVRGSGLVVRDSLRMLRADRVLLSLLAVEACWSIAMIVFEMFLPIRLAELTGSERRAGALTGPLTSAAWGAFAAGAALSGLLSRRIGVARTAILARLLNGAGAVLMGLAAGPVALAAAYLATYTLHGSNGPMHATLLHRRASAANRSTVLSMNSMAAFAAFAVFAPLLGHVATDRSTPAAMVIGGAVGVAGAVFYLPARRAERRRQPTPAPMAQPTR